MSSEWDEDTGVVDDAPPKGEPGGRDRAYLIVLTGLNVGEMFKVGTDPLILGRGDRATVVIHDDAASRRHASIRIDGGDAFIEDLRSRNGTFVNGARIEGRHLLSDGDKIQIGATTILKFTYHDHLDETFQQRMFESALRDGLTRAFNKRYFLGRLESEFRFAKRHGAPLSLLLLDIDHFKQVNDDHGHLTGDHVLSSLARRIHDVIRNEDVFARYGGEEFAILSRAIDHDHALAFGERLRRHVEAMELAHKDTAIRVTISIGVASLPHVDAGEPLELMAAADEALYAAKNSGRNRVCTVGGERARGRS
jgi:two-component system cell cycle response regulator